MDIPQPNFDFPFMKEEQEKLEREYSKKELLKKAVSAGVIILIVNVGLLVIKKIK